jgi:hypothetical protein
MACRYQAGPRLSSRAGWGKRRPSIRMCPQLEIALSSRDLAMLLFISANSSSGYGPARAAAGAEHVEPRCSSERRGADRGRPQHVASGGKAPIPAVDDELGLNAGGPVRLQLGGASLDAEPSRPNTHHASIRAPASGVVLTTLLTARRGASL